MLARGSVLLAEWWREAHEAVDIHILGLGVRKRAEVLRQRWFVKYNPMYWATVSVLVPLILVGKAVHLPLGQAGPVRDDESDAEREVRFMCASSSTRNRQPMATHRGHPTVALQPWPDHLGPTTVPLCSPQLTQRAVCAARRRVRL